MKAEVTGLQVCPATNSNKAWVVMFIFCLTVGQHARCKCSYSACRSEDREVKAWSEAFLYPQETMDLSSGLEEFLVLREDPLLWNLRTLDNASLRLGEATRLLHCKKSRR